MTDIEKRLEKLRVEFRSLEYCQQCYREEFRDVVNDDERDIIFCLRGSRANYLRMRIKENTMQLKEKAREIKEIKDYLKDCQRKKINIH